MKQRTKRVVTAWFMSLLMVLSVVMIPGGVAKADSNDANVEFYDAVLDASDTTNKTLVVTIDGKQIKVQLGKKNDGQFEPITFGEQNGNGRYEVSCQSVTDYYLYIDNSSNANYSMKVAGYDESVDNYGYFQFKNAGSNGVISVQFFGQNNGGGGNPAQKGMFEFNCPDFAVDGGLVLYKLDNATNFTQADTDGGYYHPVDVKTASNITIKIQINDDYKLSPYRGVSLRINGDETPYRLTDEEIAQLTTGYTINLLENVAAGQDGNKSVADTNYQFEFGFLKKDSIAIKSGSTKTYLLQNDVPDQAYLLTENQQTHQLSFGDGVRTLQGIGIQEDNGRYNVILDGFNDPNADLVVNGTETSISSAGINSLRSIVLCDGCNFEIRPGNSLPKEEVQNNNPQDYDDIPVTTINLNVGIYTDNGVANKVGLRDDVKVVIGSKEGPVIDAYKDIKTVELYNYDFHKRGKYTNNEIYATNAFTNVGTVELYYSVMEMDAVNLFAGQLEIFEGEASNISKGVLEVFQQAELRYNSNIAVQDGSVVLDRYYHHYPDNSKPFEEREEDGRGRTKNAGIIAFDVVDDDGDGIGDGQRYVQSTDITDDFKASAFSEERPPHLEMTKNTNSGITTIKSDDPIIYSVMYNVDDDGDGRKELEYEVEENGQKVRKTRILENGNCGQVEMKNFEKGYYVQSGSHGKFEAWIAAGQNVDVIIMPNSGYQYVGGTLNINGSIVEGVQPNQDTVGKYHFEMFESAGHISAGFAKTEDVVAVGANTGIASAAISVADGEIDNGNAKLSINAFNSEENKEDKAAIDKAYGEYDRQFVDLSFSECVVQNYDPDLPAEQQNSWDVKKSNLSKPAEITIQNSGAADADVTGYKVVRVHHEDGQAADAGEVTELKATYDASKNTVSFSTDKFSTYVLIKVKKEAQKSQDPKVDQPVVTPTPSEVGTTVTDKTNTNSSYVVSEKATGTDGVGEATYTGENAGSTATKVTIPDTFTGSDGVTYAVTKVEDGALKNNTAVTEVTVGDNVEEIGTGAFQKASNLTTVKLGKKVKKIGKNAFSGCKKLKTFKTNGTELTTVEEAAFKNDTSLASVDFSKSKIKKFGKNAFYGCKKLGKLKFNGNYVTKAEKGAFGGIKKNAVFTICAKNKTKYNKVKKLFKKAGASKAKFKFKKQK